MQQINLREGLRSTFKSSTFDAALGVLKRRQRLELMAEAWRARRWEPNV